MYSIIIRVLEAYSLFSIKEIRILEIMEITIGKNALAAIISIQNVKMNLSIKTIKIIS